MKKLFIFLLTIVLVSNFIYAQRLDDKDKWENPCPECLPGVSYSPDWPSLPTLQEPESSTPPEILRWTNDLSVVIFQLGNIYQERDKAYFIIAYRIIVSNLSGQGPLSFYLKVDQLFNPPRFTILDPSVLNRLNKYYYIKDLAIGTPQSFEDTIRVSYPFAGKKLNGQRKYLKIPVDITTTIAGSGFRSQATPVILTDPRLPNNSAKITVISPTPLIYVKPNTN